jgi:hypothetical protein
MRCVNILDAPPRPEQRERPESGRPLPVQNSPSVQRSLTVQSWTLLPKLKKHQLHTLLHSAIFDAAEPIKQMHFKSTVFW